MRSTAMPLSIRPMGLAQIRLSASLFMALPNSCGEYNDGRFIGDAILRANASFIAFDVSSDDNDSGSDLVVDL